MAIPQDAAGKPDNLHGRIRIYVKNVGPEESAGVVYVGGPDVSTTNGFPLPGQEEIVLEITDDIQLFAVTAALDVVTLGILELA